MTDDYQKVIDNLPDEILEAEAFYERTHKEAVRRWVEDMEKEVDRKIAANRQSEILTAEDFNLIVY